ncbi:MAG: hypothetical protein QM586_11625 [Xenophilus sp.]
MNISTHPAQLGSMHPDVIDFQAGVECTEREMSPEEALFFLSGPAKFDVPHARGEKVVKLSAPPPQEWRVLP